MNQENTSKLLKRFPVLYQDYYSPMQQTCMCWGFSCSDGWFEIIWQLSLAIEDHLGYTPFKKRKFMFKRTYARVWNDLIYKLSPVVCDKRERLGTGTKDDPLRWEIVGKAPDCDWTMTLAQALLPDRSSDFGSTIGSFQRSGLKLNLNFIMAFGKYIPGEGEVWHAAVLLQHRRHHPSLRRLRGEPVCCDLRAVWCVR